MGVVPSVSGGVPQTRKGRYNRVLHPAKLWTVSEFIIIIKSVHIYFESAD